MSAGKDRGAAVPDALARLRGEIDAVDSELVRLLDQRMALVLEVGEHKRAGGEEDLRRVEREEEIFARAAAASSQLTEAEIRNIFREVISCYLAREESQRVAFLGPPGTFSQQAVLQSFGNSAFTLPCNSITDAIRAVETDRARHGVVPLENSSQGLVDETLDALTDSELIIGGEVLVPINHCLMGRADTDWKKAERIYSHPQSFAQCRNWLQRQLPGVPCEPALSNGLAAEKAAQQQGALAVAPAIAAELHGLQICQRDIQDRRGNTTRFVVVGKRQVPPSGNDRTSLLAATEDRPGALLELLQIFEQHKINMTMLSSRPSRVKNWSYSFFLDVVGHRDEPAMAAVLAELQRRKCLLRLFGSYPVAS